MILVVIHARRCYPDVDGGHREVARSVTRVWCVTLADNALAAATMYELVVAVEGAAAILKKRSPNPVSLTAGCDLFIRYVTTARQDFNVRQAIRGQSDDRSNH